MKIKQIVRTLASISILAWVGLHASQAQDETVNGKLTVTGDLKVEGQQANKKALNIAGDPDLFYPVYFSDPGWYHGEFDLQIYRPHVHWDAQWHGALMARFKSHSSNWGHGGHFVDASIRQSQNSFIAYYEPSYYPAGLVVWLKGQTKYDYHSTGAVPVVTYNDSGDGSIKISNNDMSGLDEFDVRMSVSELVLTQGNSFSDNLYVKKDLGLGVANPEAKLDVRGDIQLDSFRNGYGGFRIEDDSAGDYNVSFKMGRGGNAGGYRFYSNYRPWASGGEWGNGSNKHLMSILGNGRVGIGTDTPDHKLDVAGTIRAEEIIVEVETADYVFEDGYKLRSLDEVEAHIEEHGHLPGVPNAEDVANGGGVSLGDSHRILLEKVEELTLYMIEQEKVISSQSKRLRELEKRLPKE